MAVGVLEWRDPIPPLGSGIKHTLGSGPVKCCEGRSPLLLCVLPSCFLKAQDLNTFVSPKPLTKI